MKAIMFKSNAYALFVALIVVVATGCNQEKSKTSSEAAPSTKKSDGDQAKHDHDGDEGHDDHDGHDDHKGHDHDAGHDDHKGHDHDEHAANDHSGWWCPEHGIPEEVCSMCSSKAAKKFKADGDWCEKHNRAESQCFKCDPSRAEKFTKLYVAKFGKQPPKPSE